MNSSTAHARRSSLDATSQRSPTFVGASPALRAALRQIARFAPHESIPILIEGESGTGKSFVARALHLGSPRASQVFHQVILSSLDDNIAASDLFGHLSGAYTDARQSRPGHFVSANRGTLFLDEIGKSSPSVQRKLLHAVEHREVWPVGADRAVRIDVRLVVATNIPLQTLADRGEFLPDLAARLTSFRVRLPALRERREDIPALVRQFVEHRAMSFGYGGSVPTVTPALMRALQAADWPNNLRQLDAVVQRLMIDAQGAPLLGPEHCMDDLSYLAATSSRDDTGVTPQLVRERMRELKSATAAARSLGVSRWTIYRYMERAEAAC